MDIWKIEKPFDNKIFFSNLTPHVVCYLVIRHNGNYCTVHPYLVIGIYYIWLRIYILFLFRDAHFIEWE